ncbi:hypothetical protein D3C84_1079080 [compost metagenome]
MLNAADSIAERAGECRFRVNVQTIKQRRKPVRRYTDMVANEQDAFAARDIGSEIEAGSNP